MPDPRNIFKNRYKKSTRTYSYGKVPGIEVGRILASRRECSDLGLHGPTQAGIHGNAIHGAFSVVLSGGYEDDLDEGERFWYTGEGGRKNGGGPQVEDQDWKNKNNKCLKNSCGRLQSVRVIRGYTLQSPYAPSHGYRYDGLYQVRQARQVRGKSGFLLCKFLFQRKPNQLPLPKPTPKHLPSQQRDSSSDPDSDSETTNVGVGTISKRIRSPDRQSSRAQTPSVGTSRTKVLETEVIEVEDSDESHHKSGSDSGNGSELETEQKLEVSDNKSSLHPSDPPPPSSVALGKRKRVRTRITIPSSDDEDEDLPAKPSRGKRRRKLQTAPLSPGSPSAESEDIISLFSEYESGNLPTRTHSTGNPSPLEQRSRKSLPLSLIPVSSRAKAGFSGMKEIIPSDEGPVVLRFSPPPSTGYQQVTATTPDTSFASHSSPTFPTSHTHRQKAIPSPLSIPQKPISPEDESAATLSKPFLPPVQKALTESQPTQLSELTTRMPGTGAIQPVRISHLISAPVQKQQPEPPQPNAQPANFSVPSVLWQRDPFQAAHISSTLSTSDISLGIPGQEMVGPIPSMTVAATSTSQLKPEHHTQAQPEVQTTFDWSGLLLDLHRINTMEQFLMMQKS